MLSSSARFDSGRTVAMECRRGIRYLLLAALVLAGACKRDPAPSKATTNGDASIRPPASATPAFDARVPWIEGDPERAFARARAEGSLVFLYWGAAWCPPCNE